MSDQLDPTLAAIKSMERAVVRALLFALAPGERFDYAPPFPEPKPDSSELDADGNYEVSVSWSERNKAWMWKHDGLCRSRYADAMMRMMDEDRGAAQ